MTHFPEFATSSTYKDYAQGMPNPTIGLFLYTYSMSLVISGMTQLQGCGEITAICYECHGTKLISGFQNLSKETVR